MRWPRAPAIRCAVRRRCVVSGWHPWEDEDEVLHDQSYFYMVVDSGRWQIEHSAQGDGRLPPGRAAEDVRPAIATNGWPVPANGACIATEWRDVADPTSRIVTPPSRSVPSVSGEGE
jgi:hypothetical protein